MKADLTPGFEDELKKALEAVEREIVEVDKLLTRNRIFYDRMRDVGVLTKEDAVSYGVTGPMARGSGNGLWT